MKAQNKEIDRLKQERLVIQEQTRLLSNENSAYTDSINEERSIVEKFEREIESQRVTNYRNNDDNLDLLAQSEALENHIRMLQDQNELISTEINKFISEDDDLARRLENRRS